MTERCSVAVRTIRYKVASGLSQMDVTREYGLGKGVVCRIVNRKAWTHVV